MPRSIIHAFLFVVFVSGWACNEPQTEEVKREVLAKVYNRYLYFSDMKEMVAPNISRKDSLMVVNAFIDRWIREELMLEEASRNLPEDLNIEKLVEDYRSSLILNNYEKLLVETELDSTISVSELKQYYIENETQFKLFEPVIRCRLVVYEKDNPERTDFQRWWSQDEVDVTELIKLAGKSATLYMLNDSSWYQRSDIDNLLPSNAGKPRTGRAYTYDNDDKRYYIRILEEINEGETAPLGLVKDQIIKMMLHQRKTGIVARKKEDLYERERKLNNIKIYFK